MLLRRLPFGGRRDGRIAEASECICQTLREAVVVSLRHLSEYTQRLVLRIRAACGAAIAAWRNVFIVVNLITSSCQTTASSVQQPCSTTFQVQRQPALATAACSCGPRPSRAKSVTCDGPAYTTGAHVVYTAGRQASVRSRHSMLPPGRTTVSDATCSMASCTGHAATSMHLRHDQSQAGEAQVDSLHCQHYGTLARHESPGCSELNVSDQGGLWTL